MKIFTWLVMILNIVFFVNICEARRIGLAWDASAGPDLAGYKIYWSTSYQGLFSGPRVSIDNGNKTCICFDYGNLDAIHFGVTAYNTSGIESDMVTGYDLIGNIEGDFNDKTPYSSARVDGMDLTTLGLYFGQVPPASSFDCNTCAGSSILPTDLQKSDIKKDGRIDGLDLVELGLRFGLSMPQ